MSHKIIGIIHEHNRIVGKLNAKNKINAKISSFMYINPYLIAKRNGYTGTFDEWVSTYVSLGEIVKFEINSDGCLIGTYDEKNLSFNIDNDGNLNVERR